MGKVAGIVGQAQQVGHAVIAHALITDTGKSQFCDVAIDESTGFIIYEFSFAFEGMFEGLRLFYVAFLILLSSDCKSLNDNTHVGSVLK